MLMPEWLKLLAPSRRNLKKHLNGRDPLFKSIYIYIYVSVYGGRIFSFLRVSLNNKANSELINLYRQEIDQCRISFVI